MGLRPEAFWCLTEEEYDALREVQEEPARRWAIEMATLHNAHFDTQGAAWMADDFLGRGDRAQRLRGAARNRAELLAKQMQLKKMRPGEEYDDIPDWAYGRNGKQAATECRQAPRRVTRGR